MRSARFKTNGGTLMRTQDYCLSRGRGNSFFLCIEFQGHVNSRFPHHSYRIVSIALSATSSNILKYRSRMSDDLCPIHSSAYLNDTPFLAHMDAKACRNVWSL